MQINDEKEKKLKDKKFINKRTTICIIIVAVIFLAFVIRLFNWQIINGEHYSELALSSATYSVKTDATRGEILDAQGNGLAVNITSYEIVFDKLYVDASSLNSTITELISLMEQGQEEWVDVLPIKVSNGAYAYTDDKEEIKTLRSADYLDLDDTATAQDCINLLCDRYDVAGVEDKQEVRNLLSVYYNMEKQGYSNSVPYVFAEDIGKNMVAIISENTQNISGIEIETSLTRYYPEGDLAPHILGALGSITKEEYEEKTEAGFDYGYNDKIGKFGLEYSYEDQLKGMAGEKMVEKNSQGSVTEVVKTVDAKPGNTLYLTINSELQKVANTALEREVKAARANGQKSGQNGADCETGAVVMLDVDDFSVLAVASYPTYDLNKYSLYGEYYISLANDENSPMYNRAFSGAFAPGSVYKPCIAAAGLQEGIIRYNTEITCIRYYNFFASNPVACMSTHGAIDLETAIAKSCNYYFSEVGRLLGIDTAYLYAEKFGLGVKTGIEVNESTGILAGRDSTNWTEGNTIQAAIGQSDNAFTPVQLATYVATIANDGVRLQTHLVDKITNYQRTKTLYEYDSENPKVMDTAGVSQQNMEYVQKSMLAVTQSTGGTAYSVFGEYPVKVAAKTGTAENAGSDHTVFICYAPFDDPEVAVAVILEHGSYGRYSMGVAKSLLDTYFNIKTNN